MPRLQSLAACAIGLFAAPVFAQQPTASPTPAAAVAATVNGQPVTEVAVQRGLKRVPPSEHAKARPEILNYLIDNVLLDQYLASQKIPVDIKEVDARVGEIQSEVKKHGQDYQKMLKDLMLTEEELKAQVTADLRWEKFAVGKATDAALKQLYDQNSEMFDGSLVRAQHILLTPAAGDATAATQAKAQLAQIKQQVEAEATKEAAKLPASADPLARETERIKKLEDAFGKQAEKCSACPSKKDGGDLNWFPRAGSMVESFAKAAFALKPGQMSDPVQSPFGYHLILVTARKPGQPTKFEEVKDEVREIFCNRLREELVTKLRESAKIAITPVK
jgi:parvulin-like peptidyl-prolyl isomerase